MLSVKFDTKSLENELDAMGAGASNATVTAIAAGAKVYYSHMQAIVATRSNRTGKLYDSIYRTLSKDNSSKDKTTYHISWNVKKAPHGHLIENGHVMPFQSYLGKDGKWHTMVKPENYGKPKPPSGSSFARMAEYYVLRKGGPIYIPAESFVRRTYLEASTQALAIVDMTFTDYVKGIK